MAWTRTPQDISFSTFDLNWGFFALRPIDIRADVTLLRRWLLDSRPTALPGRATKVRQLLETMLLTPERRVLLGFRDDVPAFLFETFPPEHATTGKRSGAVGVRLLASPTGDENPELATAILRTIVKMVLSDPATDRVVLESEVTHARLTRLAAGFHSEYRTTAHGTEVCVSTCTRADIEEDHPLEAAG